MIDIFITNLRKYNEGALVGEWVTLPSPTLDDIIYEISEEGEDELFISDFETSFDIKVNEYDDIYELNDLAYEVESLDREELLILKAILEAITTDLGRALGMMDDYSLRSDIQCVKDLAYEHIDEYENISEFLSHYIDYEMLGKDLAMDGYMTEYGYLEEC